MTNQEISTLFKKVAASYQILDEKKYLFQMLAYQKASDIVENLSIELGELYKEGKLNNIPGIGKTIEARLEELFRTGKVKYFESIMKNIPESVFVLLDIPSFGPKKAYKLARHFKLNNPKTVVSDLQKLALKNKISKVAGFGEKSETDILRALEEFKKNIGQPVRVDLVRATEIAEKIIDYMKKLDKVEQIETLGSLRRKKETIGDIDIAVATSSPEEVINYFVNYPKAERIIEKGKKTASIMVFEGAQIDLMTQPLENFGSLLQHQTGSKEHNIKLREYAIKKHLSLSEYGIKEKGKQLKFANEEEFYNKLGMEWIPPEIRENRGEIELSLAHKLPKLVNISDIKGDLHIHSNFPIEPSHDLGADPIEIIIQKAISLEYEYIAFSEHNPSVSKHSPSDIYDLISRRNEYIEQKTKSNKNIRIFKMLEVDILSNGNLSIDNKSSELLDGFIASVHSVFNLDKKDMTQRVLSGLTHPKAKILGHPTGRLLNERTGYQLNWDLIFDFCKKNYIAIEISSSPKRLDPPDQIIREGIKNGVKFIISTDSHALWQMEFMKYGVYMARRGWATKNDILNTLSYNEFVKWLKGGE
jgi:DNA polymerase (family X)